MAGVLLATALGAAALLWVVLVLALMEHLTRPRPVRGAGAAAERTARRAGQGR